MGLTSQQKLDHLIHEMEAIGKEADHLPVLFPAKASFKNSGSDQNTPVDTDDPMDESAESAAMG